MCSIPRAPEDHLVLDTLGLRGFNSSALGAVVMHDSRDSEDMPVKGWFLNVNNLAYREALGGASSYDAYRVDFRAFWKHGGGHVLAVRQYNWLTSEAPSAAQATVNIRGYKQGQYLSPYMSSLDVEERVSFTARWGATLFARRRDCTARHQSRSIGASIRRLGRVCTSSSSRRSA